ncbi:MAG TPA: SIMPL domain-containing protein [Marmoricola sp.]|nr:SIMPL domain-containing protein [Marmoricola sp.]
MGRRVPGIVAVAGALVVALAVVTAYALGTAGRSTATPVTAATDTPPRTMTTTGQGSATAIPDQLSFTVSVSRTEPDVSTALAVTSKEMRGVLHSLRSLGVRPKDMRTTGLHIGPHYSYSGGSEQLVGYTVTQRARVTVTDIASGGKAIAAAASAGGNDVRVGSVSLDIGNRAALLAQARKAAVRDAMAKAREYASVTGQEVGAVESLVEVRSAPPRPQGVPVAAFALRGTIDAAAHVPVRTGRQDLGVTVKVVWSLAGQR